MTSYAGTCSEPALCDHIVESCEWETAVPQDPEDQRPGASARLDMVNVLGWLEGRDESRTDASMDQSQASVLVQAWVNNVAFAKDVWTDVYLVEDTGDVACRHALPLRFSEPAGDNGDCFVGDVAASRASSCAGQPRRLRFRLYYRVGEDLFTDGLLHDRNLAGRGAQATPPAGPSRRSLIISTLLLRQASARTRRGY